MLWKTVFSGIEVYFANYKLILDSKYFMNHLRSRFHVAVPLFSISSRS